jgi:hypothetical protein
VEGGSAPDTELHPSANPRRAAKNREARGFVEGFQTRMAASFAWPYIECKTALNSIELLPNSIICIELDRPLAQHSVWRNENGFL